MDSSTYVLFLSTGGLGQRFAFKISIGKSEFIISPSQELEVLDDEMDEELQYDEEDQENGPARLEFRTNRENTFESTVFKCEFGTITVENNENEARIAIEQSETCTMAGFEHFGRGDHDYRGHEVDFSEQRLSCPTGYTLSVSAKGKPVPIPDIICENKIWQTEYFAFSDHQNIQNFIDTTQILSESGGEEMQRLTVTGEEIFIGCIQNECKQCDSPPSITSNCQECILPSIREAESLESCSELYCPLDYEFSLDGLEPSRVEPRCQDAKWLKFVETNEIGMNGKWLKIDELSCIPVGKNTSSEHNEHNNSSAIKPAAITKGKRDKNDKPTSEQYEAQSVGDWLRTNWISILTPLIMIAFTIGGIIFIVFMLRTKDEQDVFLREERRRDEERLDNGRDDVSLKATRTNGPNEKDPLV